MPSNSPITTPAPARISPVTTQPAPKVGGMRMSSGSQNDETKEACAHNHGPAQRLRGAGAAKDCFLGLFACFLCCECCEGCCDCIGDIICCPCEMCC